MRHHLAQIDQVLTELKIAKVHQLAVISFDTQHCFRETPIVYLPGREIESLLSRT